MDDRLTHPGERLIGAADQILARLDQDLDGHVLGDAVLLDQPAYEIVIGLAGGGKADLDLLETELDQQIPETPLVLDVHRFVQRLIAVAQIDTGPDRGLLNGSIGPLAVGQVHHRARAVTSVVEAAHGIVSCAVGVVSNRVLAGLRVADRARG
jgi:hypothetical protein